MALYHSQIKSITNIFCHEMYVEMICILFQSLYFKFILGKIITSQKVKVLQRMYMLTNFTVT